MFNIIPLILIVVCLAIIIVIVMRKFPALASLDIDSIQTEREAKFKEQIISNRIKRNFFRYYSKTAKIVNPVAQGVSGLFSKGYQKLIDFKDNYNLEEKKVINSDESLESGFAEVDELIKNEEYESAEKKIIEIIGIESKNVKAFRKLGEIYFERKNYGEAKQTWEHALRLLEKEQEEMIQGSEKQESENLNCRLAEIHFDLALVCIKIENIKEALSNISQSLKIEPNNPRYLDTKLEISIIKKDKHLAEKVYERLKKANPENKKLEEIQKQINELE